MKIVYSVLLASLSFSETVGQDVPSAPDNLGDLCTDQDFCVLADRQICQAACAPAACCSEDCLGENLLACAGYAACQSLIGWGSLACAGEGISSCSEDLSDPMNLQACAAACAPAACCSAEGEDNCALTSPNACATYLTCANLVPPEDPPTEAPAGSAPPGVPPAPDNIGDLCSTDQDFCVLADRQMCQAACAPATCCSADAEDNCLGGNLLACSGYASCQSLLGWGSLPCAGEGIASCSEDLSDPMNLQACAAACAPAACCSAEGEDNCALASPNACATYITCGNLILTPPPVSAPTPAPDGSGPPTVPPAPDNIGDICLGDDFCDSAALGACWAACAPAACCSAPVEEGNCLAGNAAACGTYAWCAGLIGWGAVPCAGEDIVSCSADLTEPGNYTSCAMACAPGACCGAQGDDSCLLANPNACSTYADCANLAGVPMPPVEMMPTTPAPVVEPTPEPTPDLMFTMEPSVAVASEAPTEDDSGSSPRNIFFSTLVVIASVVYANF